MKILLAYDGSTCADAAVADLRNAGFPSENEVLVVTVAHDGWPPSQHSSDELGQFGNPWKTLMADTEAYASKAAARIQAEFPGWKVSSEALWGKPTDIIQKTIDHWTPDLVVVGSHGRSAVGRLLLGSVSLNLAHHAHCSVRVVRAAVGVDGPPRILLAADGSPQANAAIREVARRRWPRDTQARVVSIVQTLVPAVPALVPALEGSTYATEAAFQVIDQADERERARLHKVAEAAGLNLQHVGLNATAVVLESDPRNELVAEAERWHANTIFVGARGLGAMDRLLLGSVSTAVVTHAHCSVEIVR